ncbi:hypothetical protein GCM10010222_32970 [Streptomyces tanashiensis]|uniref:alkylmercury lyase family protein n=1 Tax=Streptomyces tanashiensis TaxID=67367 RepID=UPI00198FDC9E|nr:alkylmercury lyase family protein [Streptomyces tanashiensis]GGS88906.1 hypothetical protein GCM10010222_32970 [Streptomyces tanashiensis]
MTQSGAVGLGAASRPKTSESSLPLLVLKRSGSHRGSGVSRIASNRPRGTVITFSARETRHKVRLGGGVEVWSMCAIDALGVAAMLDQDVQVTSCDPVGGRRITVAFTGGSARWEPEEAVVFVGRRAGEGPAADVCCEALNFFADRSTAELWTRRHPEFPGRIISQDEALVIGARTFGPLLADD